MVFECEKRKKLNEKGKTLARALLGQFKRYDLAI